MRTSQFSSAVALVLMATAGCEPETHPTSCNAGPPLAPDLAPVADGGTLPACSALATELYGSNPCKIDPNGEVRTSLDDHTLGYSARDVLAAFNSPGVGTLSWWDGTRTTVHVHAEPVDDSPGSSWTPPPTVTVSAPPPASGYCNRSMRIATMLRLSTDDGRWEQDLTTTLVALDYGARFQVVWPSFGDLELPSATGRLAFPDWWVRPGHRLALQIVVQPASNLCSAYCPNQTVPSGRDEPLCTTAGGKLVATSFADEVERRERVPECPRVGTLATWTWAAP
jgi:hypothetical protein